MNKYCENCFYWVNRKEENPNKSNCNVCASNPYNKYEGVVLKCKNNEELKIAQEFFIKRGIPVGFNKFTNMYPCDIGIDEHIMKIKYAFTTYNVFNLKNIILGESNNKNEFVTWIGYEWVSIDVYLSTRVKSEKEDLLDKKEITINTNSSVVGYIAGYHIAGENNISCYTKNKSESPYEKWDKYFVKVRNKEEYLTILNWWNKQGVVIVNSIFLYPSEYPAYIGVNNYSFIANLTEEGFKQIKSPVLIKQIQDDKTGEVIYTLLNEEDSKKETKTEIPNMGGFHCDMNLTGYVTNTGHTGYETNTGHVTGNQNTYVSPGNFYTMSTEEKLNYLYKLNLNK